MVEHAGGSPSELSDAFSEAQEWVRSSIGGARILTADEISAVYQRRNFSRGWRFPVDLGRVRVELDLLLPRQFPRKAPRVALVDRSLFLKLPHVESDGMLCLLQDHAEVDPYKPLETVRRLLFLAGRLLEDGFAGKNRKDFQDEFRSYWPDDQGAMPVRSLLTPSGPSRVIHAWRGKHLCIVGDDVSTVTRWMQNRFDKGKTTERATTKALYISLQEALFPEEFPNDAKHVLRIAKTHAADAVELLTEMAAEHPDEIIVVIGANTVNGPALGAITMRPPRKEYRGPSKLRVDKLTAGFRPGKVPKSLMTQRMLGGQTILRSRVDRVDPAWIHGRGTDPRQATLSQKSVVIVGCGSVGGAVANLLAQAGVGHLALIDPDTLSWANVGRHVLGAQAVGTYKAEELAQHLRVNFPHVREVVSRPTTWQEVAETSPEIMEKCDLIVSTIGSWSEEGALNDWHRSSGNAIPVIYGWTEAHAAAGHAVAIFPIGGCLACGLSTFGVPKLQVSQWSDGVSRLQEPACGAVYQPYGPIELANVNGLVANLCLQMLLHPKSAPRHLIWSAPYNQVKSMGGTWTPEWQAIAGDRSGGFIEERNWPAVNDCLSCHGAGI
jgi:sulfur-carrier protein adenylyltransferase/sulfurtransferase